AGDRTGRPNGTGHRGARRDGLERRAASVPGDGQKTEKRGCRSGCGRLDRRTKPSQARRASEKMTSLLPSPARRAHETRHHGMSPAWFTAEKTVLAWLISVAFPPNSLPF